MALCVREFKRREAARLHPGPDGVCRYFFSSCSSANKTMTTSIKRASITSLKVKHRFMRFITSIPLEVSRPSWLAARLVTAEAAVLVEPAGILSRTSCLFEATAGARRVALRTLTDHIANPANAEIRIVVLDNPGQGGANHHYEIDLTHYAQASGSVKTLISFQNGPIKEVGVNGVTQEALLAIVIDRLRGFQSGQFKCRENAIALTKCEEALMWLQKRTRDRLARGVEGTNQK